MENNNNIGSWSKVPLKSNDNSVRVPSLLTLYPLYTYIDIAVNKLANNNASFFQTRSPYGYLVVNLDSTLSEILLEIRHLTRPPLNLHLPTALRQLMKNIDYDELRHRQTCLQVTEVLA